MFDYNYDEEYSVQKDYFSGRTMVYDEFGDEVGEVDSSIPVGEYYGQTLEEKSRECDRVAALNVITPDYSAATSSYDYSYDSVFDTDYDSDDSSQTSDDSSFVFLIVFVIVIIPMIATFMMFEDDGAALILIGPIVYMFLTCIVGGLTCLGISIFSSLLRLKG